MKNKSFTLIEMIISLAVFAFVTGSMIVLFQQGFNIQGKARNKVIAMNLARQTAEALYSADDTGDPNDAWSAILDDAVNDGDDTDGIDQDFIDAGVLTVLPTELTNLGFQRDIICERVIFKWETGMLDVVTWDVTTTGDVSIPQVPGAANPWYVEEYWSNGGWFPCHGGNLWAGAEGCNYSYPDAPFYAEDGVFQGDDWEQLYKITVKISWDNGNDEFNLIFYKAYF